MQGITYAGFKELKLPLICDTMEVLIVDISPLVDQWFTTEKGKKINKGEKIGEYDDPDMSKCCERCFPVAPLTNAGFFFRGRCVCFKVTGIEKPP